MTSGSGARAKLPLRRPLLLPAAALCLAVSLGTSGRLHRSRPLVAPAASAPARAFAGAGASVAPATLAAVATPASSTALLQAAQPFLLDAATLAGAPSEFPNEGAVELYHLRYEQVMPSGLSGLVVQRVFQVRTEAAAEMFVLDDLWYDSSRSQFDLVDADVLRHGRVLAGRDLGDLRPGGSGNQPRHIELPPLEAGDRISLLYELAPDEGHDWSLLDGHFLGNLFAFRDSYATLRARYVLAAPAAHARRIAVSAVGVGPAVRGHSATGESTWSWAAENQPAFFSSPDGPSITDRSPFVQVSGFRTWAGMANWYSDLLARRARLQPGFERHLLALVARPAPLAASLPAAASSDPAAIRATVDSVWSYLAAHLSYEGDESGIHAYVPAPVGEVFQSGRGDCKDGALLLTTWLRAVGIEADLALVRTPEMGRLAPPQSNGEVPATMAAFDHALVFIPATGQWIDTTAPNYLGSELPSSDQNSLALIVRAGQHALVHVPVATAAANSTRRSIELVPGAAGWFDATGSMIVTGADAPLARQRYASTSGRRQALARWLRTYFPEAEVNWVEVSGVTPPSDAVEVKFNARVRESQFSAAWLQPHYTALLAAQTARSQPLEVPLRWSLDETWSLRVGDTPACTAYQPPTPLAQRGRFGSYSIISRCAQGWLQVRSQVVQTALSIPPDQYGAFRAFWLGVDQRLNAPLVLPAEQQNERALLTLPLANR